MFQRSASRIASPPVAPTAGAAGEAHRAPTDDERRDATWFDSSWDLRRGLVVAELDELPPEWRHAG